MSLQFGSTDPYPIGFPERMAFDTKSDPLSDMASLAIKSSTEASISNRSLCPILVILFSAVSGFQQSCIPSKTGSISAIRRAMYSRGIDDKRKSFDRYCIAVVAFPVVLRSKKWYSKANGAIKVPVIGDCGGSCNNSTNFGSRVESSPPVQGY